MSPWLADFTAEKIGPLQPEFEVNVSSELQGRQALAASESSNWANLSIRASSGIYHSSGPLTDIEFPAASEQIRKQGATRPRRRARPQARPTIVSWLAMKREWEFRVAERATRGPKLASARTAKLPRWRTESVLTVERIPEPLARLYELLLPLVAVRGRAGIQIEIQAQAKARHEEWALLLAYEVNELI